MGIDIEKWTAVVGKSTKYICNIVEIKNIRGATHYSWRNYYKRFAKIDYKGCANLFNSY
jgi:hypothetical protein